MKTELQYWMRKWELDDNLIYKNGAEHQAAFVRSQIVGNLLHTRGFVVSTHTSKSCELPVYRLKMRNGIRLTMRCNFYDWKVSVETPDDREPLPKDFLPTDCMSHSMVERDFEPIAPCYLEGFRREWCFGAYRPEQPPRKFTIEVPDDWRLYTLLHSLKHAYPDVAFDPAKDPRTEEMIKEAIDRLLLENGFHDLRPDNRRGEVTMRPVMSAWEVIWRTYSKMDEMYYDHKMTIDEFPSVSDKSEDYARVIMRFPEAHEEFLREEWMFDC